MAGTWKGVEPQLHEAFTALAGIVAQAGGVFTLTSTIRSHREQQFLYNRYLKGQSGGLPAALPYHSAHEYGWAFDAVTSPWEWQADVGQVFQSWGGVWGAKRDPVHFELPGAGAAAFAAGEALTRSGTSGTGRQPPVPGGAFYKLADFLSSFVPGLGEVQLVDKLVSLLDGNDDLASWYLQHPAEALRDIGKLL